MLRYATLCLCRDDTFFESCGVADLIATCYGGRNRLVAREFVAAELAGAATTFAELEAKLLNGQKLQGVLTSDEVQAILFRRGWEKDYPLFTTGGWLGAGVGRGSRTWATAAAGAARCLHPCLCLCS